MRIWDINPGYLNRNSLLGEHRELHGMYNILSQGKKGYSRHPETLRWKNCLPALYQRHEQLTAEMKLRGYKHHSPINEHSIELTVWPEIFIDPPAEQINILISKYEGKENGRILFPKNAQELWAQHKYSVLARDPNYYKDIGPALAKNRKDILFAELLNDLIVILRIPPAQNRLLNAFQHMYGYVSDYSDELEIPDFDPDNPVHLFKGTQELAVKFNVFYLLQSTALSELGIYLSM